MKNEIIQKKSISRIKSPNKSKQAFIESKYPELQEIADLLYKKNSISELSLCDDSLELRQKLIDWMLIVTKNLMLSDLCYFIAVEIFDSFLEKSTEPGNIFVERTHLIAVICIILATKYQEIKYISIEIAHKYICHEKYKISEFKDYEIVILKALKFKIGRVVIEDFTDEMINETLILDRTNKQSMDFLIRAIKFVYRLLLQNYNFYRKIDVLVLYFSIFYFCLKCKFMNIRIPFQSLVFFEIAEKFKVKKKAIFECTDMIKAEYDLFLNNTDEYEFLFSKDYSLLA